MTEKAHHGDVVVVDNDNELREATVKKLSDLGYSVTECVDGNQCIRMMERKSWKWNPKIILIDSILPGLSSFELLRRLNKQFEKKETVLIMTSKYSAPEDEIEAGTAGANGFIVKPLSVETLNNILTRAEEKRLRASKLPEGLQQV